MNLRKEAKGRECQIRIPQICNKNNETVVLAHLNNKGLFGVGTGQKPPDMFGAWACSECHDAVDGRNAPISPTLETVYYMAEMTLSHMEGVFRTQNILLKEGKI